MANSSTENLLSAITLDEVAFDWEITLRARNAAQNTLDTYLTSLRLFGEFLQASGGAPDIGLIGLEHIERFLAHMSQIGRKPATVHNRYRALKSFFGWLADRGDDGAALIVRSPMERMKPPILPEPRTPLLRDEEVARLLQVCKRDRTFEGTRDHALIMFMLNTGARRAEVVGMRWLADEDDPKNSIIDWRRGLVRL
jgi:site-specific recombinase XerD